MNLQPEQQIMDQQRTVDYDTREFTIELMVNKYLSGLEKEENEVYVPEYQREFVWDSERQSKFIESLILGIPIPLIFLAENKHDGRLEIVDGSQRIRTLAAYVYDELELSGLEKLDSLNGFRFSNLVEARQRKFKNISLKMIVLSEKASEEVRNDMFERINRGSDLLKDMEKRKGIYRGDFSDFLYKECAENELFKKLTPLSTFLENRQEHEELLLRYFCLTEYYPSYRKIGGIAKTLDQYIASKNESFSQFEHDQKKEDFERMISFVEKNFKFGFAKSSAQQVSRVYFEAIAVGTHLALKDNPNLLPNPNKTQAWIKSKDFKEMVSGKYHTHKHTKIRQRVEFIRDRLLENA